MLLLGWQDADHVLALVVHSYEQPRRFALLAIADGQRQVLGTLPRPMGVNCEQLSPDGTKVLMRLDYGSTLFDLSTQQYQDIAPAPGLVDYDAERGELRLRAGPRARSELRQRVRVAAGGRYQLRVELQSTVAIANLSTRFRLRQRSVTAVGTPWTELQVISPRPGQTTFTVTAEFDADQAEQQISLLATFPAGDTSSAWTLRGVVLTRLDGATNMSATPTATPLPAPVPTQTPVACPPAQPCLEPTLAPAWALPLP